MLSAHASVRFCCCFFSAKEVYKQIIRIKAAHFSAGAHLICIFNRPPLLTQNKRFVLVSELYIQNGGSNNNGISRLVIICIKNCAKWQRLCFSWVVFTRSSNNKRFYCNICVYIERLDVMLGLPQTKIFLIVLYRFTVYEEVEIVSRISPTRWSSLEIVGALDQTSIWLVNTSLFCRLKKKRKR